MSQLVGAIQNAVHFTIADKIGDFLTEYIPSAAKRALLSVGSCILLYVSPMRSSLAMDLCLVVTASTVLAIVVDGFDIAATVSHACAFLLVCERVGADGLTENFVSNIQYLFANTLTTAFVTSPTRKVFAAVAAWGMSLGVRSVSRLLSDGLVMAGTGILKGVIVDAIPVALKLPTVVCIMCFAKPFSTSRYLGGQLYSFTLYLSADTIQQSITPPHVAFFVCICFYMLAPTKAYEALAQVACVGVATNIVIAAVQNIAAKADPFPAFVSLLVIARVAISVLHRLHIE